MLVNFVKQTNLMMEFGKRNRLTCLERILWQSLFYIANRIAMQNGNHDWPEDYFPVPNSEIEDWSGLNERQVRDIRNRLKQYGVIDFRKGNGRKSDPEYRLFYLTMNSYRIVPDRGERGDIGCKSDADRKDGAQERGGIGAEYAPGCDERGDIGCRNDADTGVNKAIGCKFDADYVGDYVGDTPAMPLCNTPLDNHDNINTNTAGNTRELPYNTHGARAQEPDSVDRLERLENQMNCIMAYMENACRINEALREDNAKLNRMVHRLYNEKRGKDQ